MRNTQDQESQYHAIIIGGSFAGLSAALALGRSLKKVLLIDDEKPCNIMVDHSHNFLTHDGHSPLSILKEARTEVMKYPTVKIIMDRVISAIKIEDGFEVKTTQDATFTAKKLLFSTGIKDQMPDIKGFLECWGKSIFHCPYCHAYEIHHKPIAVMAQGDMAFEMIKMISNWTDKYFLLSNGPSGLSEVQLDKFRSKDIKIIEKKIISIEHDNGVMHQVCFEDGSMYGVNAILSRIPFRQSTSIPQDLGCDINEMGYIRVDELQQTSVPDIFAAGDCSSAFRSVSGAVADGSKAGALMNRQFIDESF